jgi:hypothetical protein
MKRRRHVWLGAMLAATLLATWLAAGVEEEGAAAAQAPRASARSAARPAVDSQAALLAQLSRMDRSREPMPEPPRDPFFATSVQPPPPPEPAAQVIATPAPPPLPFQFQGLLRQEGKLAVFLVDGSQLLMAREGETLAGQYRVERLTEKEIILQHLPQGERQTLNFER